jgi:hypothetical protein
VTVSLAGPVALAVPLLVTLFAVFAWGLWDRSADPPRLRGYAVRQGWQVDPIALLNRDLQDGRMAAGVLAVHDLVLGELTGRHHVSARAIRRQSIFARPDEGSPLRRACDLVVALETTYEIAYRAEDRKRTDLWSRWRRPKWRELARQRFGEELSAVESVWPLLENPS